MSATDESSNPELPAEVESALSEALDSEIDNDRFAALLAKYPEHADSLQRRRAQLQDSHLSESIGGYRIFEVLGEGGMGTVYRAEQVKPVRRSVALKLIKLGMDSQAVVRRFEQERQALALMDHDGIAKVFDCGTSERGQPYFVMELVRGMPLNDYCERNRLSLPDRLRLIQQVCSAVQHAHQKGVVHRDLKPANVLVGEGGGKVHVKIIDFGLAKAMGASLTQGTLFTAAGQILGTPEYMAPEQADPGSSDIDTRADIYSLGVMLYEVLVGQLPFPADELRRAGMMEVQRVLVEVVPRKPSTKLTTSDDATAAIARARRTSVGSLRRALRGDLDWAVLKSLEKDRARRYDSANALAADLQRYLDHEPLEAGPPSPGYRVSKLLRRYRGQVVAGAAVLLTAVVGAIVAINYAIEADARAEENAKLVVAEKKATAEAARQAKSEAAARKEMEWRSYASAVRLAASHQRGEAPRLLSPLHDCPPSLRGWEWYWLNAQLDSSLATIPHRGEATSASFCPEGRRVLIATRDGMVQIWDLATLELREEWRVGSGDADAFFSPDGSRVFSVAQDLRARHQPWLSNMRADVWDAHSGEHLATLRDAISGGIGFALDPRRPRAVVNDAVFHLETGQKLFTLGDGEDVQYAVFSRDGALILAISTAWNDVCIHDAEDGGVVGWLRSDGRFFDSVNFGGRGGEVVTTSRFGAVRIWDATTREMVREFEHDKVELAFVSPDDSHVVTLGAGIMRCWDVATSKVAFERRDVASARFSPQGTVVTLGRSGELRFFDPSTGSTSGEIPGKSGFLSLPIYCPSGRRFLTKSDDGQIRLWDSVVPRPARRVGSYEAGFDSDGGVTLVLAKERGLGVRSTAREGTQPLNLGASSISDLVFKSSALELSPDGRLLSVEDGTNLVRVWDVLTGRVVHSLALTSWLRFQAFAPDGSQILIIDADGDLIIWDLSTGDVQPLLDAATSSVEIAAFSADGSRVVAAARDGAIRVWDVADDRCLITKAIEGEIQHVAFDSAARQVVVAAGGGVYILDVDRGQFSQELQGHDVLVEIAEFVPDGGRVLTIDARQKGRIWSVESGELLVELDSPSVDVLNLGSVAFTADGSRLLIAFYDYTGMWDVQTGARLVAFHGHRGAGRSATFGPFETRVLDDEFQSHQVFDAMPYRVHFLERQLRDEGKPWQHIRRQYGQEMRREIPATWLTDPSLSKNRPDFSK